MYLLYTLYHWAIDTAHFVIAEELGKSATTPWSQHGRTQSTAENAECESFTGRTRQPSSIWYVYEYSFRSYRVSERSPSQLEVIDCRLEVNDCPLKVTDYPLEVNECPLEVTDFTLKVTDCRLEIICVM